MHGVRRAELSPVQYGHSLEPLDPPPLLSLCLPSLSVTSDQLAHTPRSLHPPSQLAPDHLEQRLAVPLVVLARSRRIQRERLVHQLDDLAAKLMQRARRRPAAAAAAARLLLLRVQRELRRGEEQTRLERLGACGAQD